MYRLLRKLNDELYEGFETYSSIEECKLAAKIISAVCGYKIEEFMIQED